MTARAGRRSLRPCALPLLVLGVGFAVTWAAVLASSHALGVELHAQFARHADLVEFDASRRLMRAEYGASSVRAGHAAAGRLGDAELRAFVAARDLEREFAGIRGFSVVERVRRRDLAAFVAHQRAATHPDFTIHGSGRDDDLFVVRSVAPLEPNRPALGLDVGNDPVRRAALQQAIDTGAIWMTGPVRLVQDGKQGPGWALFAAIYDGRPTTVQQRRESLLALVSVPVVASELLAPLWELAGDKLRFRLYDGAPDDGQLILASSAEPGAGRFTTDRPLRVGNHLLTLRMDSTPALEAGTGRLIPTAIGIGGVGLSALLALLTWLLADGRLSALKQAAVHRANAHRLRAIVERSIGSVFAMDLDGRLTWTNRSFENFTGRPQKDLIGREIGELLGLDWLDEAQRDAIRHELATGGGHRTELALQRPDGLKWVEVALGPERDEDGRLTGSIGIALDVTRRKDVERQLQEREHLVRMITDNIPACVSYWDARNTCLFANRRFREIWAGHPPAASGPMHSVLPGQAPDEADAYRAEVLRGMPQQFEHVLGEPGGRASSWQVHLIPDIDGETVDGYFALANEVTELKNARDLALEASQAKSRFLSSMSHEIRTPMNAVLGMLSLLRATDLTERQSDYAGKAEGAARSLLSLLNDVLDFSKIEAGKMQLASRPFSLEQLLADLSVVLSANVGDKPVEVLYDLDPSVPDALVGDDMRVRQVLINLGGNAIKFTPAGEVVIATRLLRRGDGDVTIEFSVRDTGIGISPAEQERLFTDYAQAGGHTARQFGGTGLGLGICRRLTELMGSRLELASEPGRGSRFWFTVTLQTQVVGPAVDTAPRSERVLVVDDNEAARGVLCALAASLGWQADSCSSGEAAVAQVAAATASGLPYDAVFVDWRMPGLDGWDTSVRIRALPGAGHTPLLVMVTAHARAMLDGKPAGSHAVLDGLIVKPVTAAMLREALERARRPHRDAAEPRAAQAQPLAGLRLLVAEDNPVNQQIARELLGARGAQVEVVEDGRPAVDAIAAGREFDALLMDMLMPGMDGIEATIAIRRLPRGQHLPIIAMTANAMDSDREACLAAGMDDHVGKPVAIDEVVGAILRHVQHRAAPDPADNAPMQAPVPVLDRDAAIARLGGNVDLFQRLLPVFRTNLRKGIDDVRAAVAAGAHETLWRAMHTIRGMAGTLGAPALATLAAVAETRLRDGAAVDDASVAPVLLAVATLLDELA